MSADEPMPADRLVGDLVDMLRATRDAERMLFGALPVDVRERPMRPGDWSPKDHLAHLAAWKQRQADRYLAVQRGQPAAGGDESETDAINAELQARTAHLSWDQTVALADEASEGLIAAVEGTDPEALRGSDRLITGTFGNGVYHALQHFTWLREADIGVGPEPATRLARSLDQLLERGTLPEREQGVALYNAACYLALAGDVARARELLPRSFRLRPDLVKLAGEDSDLLALRDEIPALAAQ